MKLPAAVAALCLGLLPLAAAAAPVPERRLVIVDNDFGVPVSGIQAVPVLTDSSMKLLGIITLFADKVRDIVGLYLSPPSRALVLGVDKKSQIQALDREQPVLPMMLGHARASHP